MWTIWCEWNIGHEGLVFSSIEKAREWCRHSSTLKECFFDGGNSIEELENDQGLLGFEELEVDPAPEEAQ